MEIIFAGLVFVGLFAAWVVVPTVIRKHHALVRDDDLSE
jgi:uncharacterized membrane protein YesL